MILGKELLDLLVYFMLPVVAVVDLTRHQMFQVVLVVVELEEEPLVDQEELQEL